MCEATTIAYASLALAAAGAGASASASRKQQSAMADASLAENKRQSDATRQQMAIQDQQRADAERARDRFQNQTLDAFTRDQVEKDTAQEQSELSKALATAGERAVKPSVSADATQSSGASQVVQSAGEAPQASAGGPSSAAYSNALREALARAAGFNAQQADAQAALAAVSNAHRSGAERLQQAGQSIQLANAQAGALGQPAAALNLFRSASRDYYGTQLEAARNKGATQALIGASLSSLGSAGYGYGSAGGLG